MSLFIASWYPMKYIYDNLSYNYIFPFLSFHIYSAFLYIWCVLAYFYATNTNIISKVIGLLISLFIGFQEFRFFNTYPDTIVKYIYLASIIIGATLTIILLFRGKKHGKKKINSRK